MSGEKFIFPIAHGMVKLSGGDQVLRTSTFIVDRPNRGEESCNLQGESDRSWSTPHRDSSSYDDEARNDFSSISGNFIYRHHVEPRVKLYVPRKESFAILLKYIDVTRTTDATLDVMLEKDIDDYRNVDGDRELSDTWTGVTRFTLLNEIPPDGFSWSGDRRLFKARNLDRYVRSVQAKRKAKVFTRTQCTGPIGELLRRRDVLPNEI